MNAMTMTLDMPAEEQTVLDRYARAAREVEPALCCPTDGYDPEALALLPREIIEKDYGCGDPSRYVGPGETVLDLGSGGGKVCYLLAKKVGSAGRVIGLDFNDAMLALARKYLPEMTAKLGYANVTFHKARIQDMALDLDALDRWLHQHPVRCAEDVAAMSAHMDHLRHQSPLIGDDSVDVIVSNCVLNLVDTRQKERLFKEMFRVLRKGGRAVISDIVCDEQPPLWMQQDPDLWSGCISGAFREDQLLAMFEQAGFHGIEILKRDDKPWRTVEGIEFRAMTVRAYKGKQGPCLERHQAVVYRGPWREVRDDDGHVFRRGQRMAVCDKTFRLMTDPHGPYAGQVLAIEPLTPVAPDQARPFDCRGATLRDPRQTKGFDYRATIADDRAACCEPGSDCC